MTQHKTEQQQARTEILAVLALLLGSDGNKPVDPEALDVLHSIAVATREYLLAEQQAEQLDVAAETILRESTSESTGPVKDWTYGEMASYLRERGLVLQVRPIVAGGWTASVRPLEQHDWTHRAENEPSFQDAIMAVLDQCTGRRDENTWRTPGND